MKTAREMLDYLRALYDPTSEVRKTYRENKRNGKCPICGTAEKTTTYCLNCYTLVKQARSLATQARICSNCFSRPVAPPKKKSRYHGVVTQCLVCRDEAEQRKMDSKLSKVIGGD